MAALLPLLLQCSVAVTEASCSDVVPMKQRREVISITDFGAVGDGKTLNTWPFKKAIYRIQHLRRRGGTLLYVPPGVWLTGSISLTSHMTLYLARGAVIKATQAWRWPLVDPLPSYGRGRELPGRRYMSFIQGDGISDVIITGDLLSHSSSGLAVAFCRGSMRHTVVSMSDSTKGTVSWATLAEAPRRSEWNNRWSRRGVVEHVEAEISPFHKTKSCGVALPSSSFRPSVDLAFKEDDDLHLCCSNVVIKYVTVFAPHDSPNTDGIDPDSSSNVCIEDTHISTGDDLVAIKSGWDEYGIAYGRPSSGITIRRLTGSSPFSGVAIGSETSGGVENVLVENVDLYDTGIGIHIKTNVGRGGFIRNITVVNVSMNKVRKGIRIAGDVGDHPDEYFDRRAIPTVDGITIKNVRGVDVQQPGSIQGIKNSPFTRICLSNVKLWGAAKRSAPWKCVDVSGAALGVQPWPCSPLARTISSGYCSTAF
ncbi:Glycosyl hydrolases family 28 [Musa troglodytarum]|uniref:Glycosyl hydrolases family 28 n=1 Tax=Musa troglodytarum TaxID=320322 RepID=A0A9E7H645_9LILI|nr:Glycosyl hydrolases family 28 [Musa troglodytarum]